MTVAVPFIFIVAALYLFRASAPPWASIAFLTTATASGSWAFLSSAGAAATRAAAATRPNIHFRMTNPPGDRCGRRRPAVGVRRAESLTGTVRILRYGRGGFAGWGFRTGRRAQPGGASDTPPRRGSGP